MSDPPDLIEQWKQELAQKDRDVTFLSNVVGNRWSSADGISKPLRRALEEFASPAAQKRVRAATEESWAYHEQAQRAERRARSVAATLSGLWEDLEGMHDAGCLPAFRPKGGCRACGAQSRIEDAQG